MFNPVTMRSSNRFFPIILFFCIIFYSDTINGQLTAIIKYEYYSSSSNYLNITQEIQTNGIVSTTGSQRMVQNRPAFILIDSNGKYDGCQPAINSVTYSNGIAIIQRGGDCTFSVKVTRAKQYNASAVIIYDPQNNGQDTFDMLQNNSDVLCLYVQQTLGIHLFNLANNNQTYLNLTIEPVSYDYETSDRNSLWYNSRGAIVFIVISICVVISLCISWLIFYYCQRCRLRTSKDRLQNRLIHAAKKTLTKIPLITITEQLYREESCVICLDTIKIGDTIRQLICGHRFHQHCVDPWLINHRHCPLCNLDILAAYRISIPGENPIRFDLPEQPISTILPTVINNEQIIPIPTISGSLKDDNRSDDH